MHIEKELKLKQNNCNASTITELVECPECLGTGEALEFETIYEDKAYEKEICFTCEGEGMVSSPQCNEELEN